jgi:hypothetical protein
MVKRTKPSVKSEIDKLNEQETKAVAGYISQLLSARLAKQSESQPSDDLIVSLSERRETGARAKCSNGKKSGVKTSNAPLRMPFANYELRITNFKSVFRLLVILCALFNSAEISFAQDNSFITPEEIDLLPYRTIFQTETTKLNVERKRDALLELRNYRTAAASRIAVAALKDSSEIVRATAAASAVFLPSDEAARHLLPLLADKKPFVRREAAYALGAVRSPNAINSLLQIAQKDKVAEVRNAAIIALGEIGDARRSANSSSFYKEKRMPKKNLRAGARRAPSDKSRRLSRRTR